MKLATYNIWNSSRHWDERLPRLRAVLADLDADIVAIQEAPTVVAHHVSFEEYFTSAAYPYVRHFPYPTSDEGERPEGLAFLSKADFVNAGASWAADENTGNNWAASVCLYCGSLKLRVTNVHLDYRSAGSRNSGIFAIVKALDGAVGLALDVLCGDFNCNPNSGVDRFLKGATLLDGFRTHWADTAELAPESHAVESPTLDLIHNLRWTVQAMLETPGRLDRIYTRGPNASTSVATYALFGTGKQHRRIITESWFKSPGMNLECQQARLD